MRHAGDRYRRPGKLQRTTGWGLLTLLLMVMVPTQAQELAIIGARLISDPAAEAIEDAVVIVRDGRIAAVGDHESIHLPDGIPLIDGRGKTLTAGFWNSHVHFTSGVLAGARSAPADRLQAALREMLVRWGVTAAFEIGGIPGNAATLRDRIARGELDGPLLLSASAPFFPRDGTPVYVREEIGELGKFDLEAGSRKQARQRARQQLGDGADAVKLFTGAILEGPGQVMPMDEAVAKAIVRRAHARGKPAFAHPTNRAGIDISLASGVDILAHATPVAGPWPEHLVRTLVQADIALVPTLYLFEVELAKEDAPEPVRAMFRSNAGQQVKALADAGGTILFGTDVGYIHDADTTREFALLAEAGLDWRAILAALTSAPAERFGYGQLKGRVAPGMDADLVLLAGDPRRDATVFARVAMTIREGRVIHEAPQPPDAPANRNDAD